MRTPSPSLIEASERMRFLAPFTGKAVSPPPIWLMRQAGRYLPEYRATRKEAGSFLDLCYNPQLAAEVTFQPIRRYGLDAAILFSDILIVPHALGQDVRFVEGEGPKLDPIEAEAQLTRLDPAGTDKRFSIVDEAVERIRAGLPAEVALIGFCGAPWTVATYMVGGGGSKDQAETRLFAFRDPAGFQKLMDILVETSVEYLSGQVKAGADVLQLFDTWAGSLPPREFDRWVIAPTRRIVAELNARHPDVPVIGFARGAGANAQKYARETGCDAVGCDTAQSMAYARAEVGEALRSPLQGNLDPLLLVAGGDELDATVDEILETMDGHPFIFNLGHGIVPQTPPDNVARLIARVRKTAA